MHGKLFGHFYSLQAKRVLVDADPLKIQDLPELTKPPVGGKRRLLGSQDDFVKYDILENKSHQGENDNGCNGA
jgi:hypothetical protein